MFAYERLEGLDRERVLGAIVPILQAHRVCGVELEWKTDSQGRVLLVTVEAADTSGEPAEFGSCGVTIDVCAELSRDISAALDVADCIGPAYRLEVGSPGVERALYGLQDYKRFRGQAVSIKLATAQQGQWAVEGRLLEVSDAGVLTLEASGGQVEIAFENIKKGRLIYEFGRAQARSPRGATARGLARGKRAY